MYEVNLDELITEYVINSIIFLIDWHPYILERRTKYHKSKGVRKQTHWTQTK